MKLTAAQKIKREKAKLRKQQQVLRRKQKREKRMAPKHRLTAWAQRVKEQAENKCAVCGCGPRNTGKIRKGSKTRVVIVPLNAHHILPKESYPAFKFKRVNGVMLCVLHHKYAKHSAHKNPVWFSEWLRNNRPLQWKWAMENMGSHNDKPK